MHIQACYDKFQKNFYTGMFWQMSMLTQHVDNGTEARYLQLNVCFLLQTKIKYTI